MLQDQNSIIKDLCQKIRNSAVEPAEKKASEVINDAQEGLYCS